MDEARITQVDAVGRLESVAKNRTIVSDDEQKRIVVRILRKGKIPTRYEKR